LQVVLTKERNVIENNAKKKNLVKTVQANEKRRYKVCSWSFVCVFLGIHSSYASKLHACSNTSAEFFLKTQEIALFIK
jgi:hypothetical protein